MKRRKPSRTKAFMQISEAYVHAPDVPGLGANGLGRADGHLPGRGFVAGRGGTEGRGFVLVMVDRGGKHLK